MRLTIANKIGLLLVLPTAGALLALGVFYRFLRQTAPYADYLATAQDQRLHARLLHVFADRTGIEAADRDYLGSAVRIFDEAWSQRRPPPPPEALPSIQEVRRLWAEVRPKLAVLAGQPAGDPAAGQTHRLLLPDVPHLQRACERVVGILEAKLESLRRRMLRTLAWICGVDLALLLAGLWITTLHIAGPLRLLEQAAHRMQGGDFTYRVPVAAGDEIGALSHAFNQMSAKVARLVAAVGAGRRHSESILASVPLGLLVVGPDLRILSWNAHIPANLSPDPYDLAGRTLPEVLPASGVQEHALAVLATGAPVSNLFWELPGGDPSAVMKISITRMQEPEPGQDRHLLVVLEDLSELERLRAAAQASERRYYLLLQDLDAIVWEARTSPFRFLFVSQRAETLLGYPPQWWLNQPDFFLRCLHPDDRNCAHVLDAAGGDGETQKLDCRVITADLRVVWLRLSFRGLEDGTLRGVMVDITGSKRAEKEMIRYNAELEQLAHAAAHHLQEPLRAVASFSQLLSIRYESQLDARADQFLHFLVQGATRMRGLVADLLEYVRVAGQNGRFRRTAAGAAFEQALGNLGHAVRESRAEVTHDPLPALLVDPRQFAQLLQNLLDNALKFRSAKSPRVHVSAEASAAEWLFRVRDNGIGIDPRYHRSIFDIFHRLHGQQEYPGTGIGLAICRRIVEHHHGRIWVESEVGAGALFCFTIPRQDSESPAPVLL